MSLVIERLEKLRKLMKENNIDAYIICTDDFHGSEYVGEYFKARRFMSGFTGSAGTLVVLADEAGLWTDGRYFLQAADQLKGSTIELMKMGEENVPTIAAFLADKLPANGVVGFDGRTVKVSFVNEIISKTKDKNISFAYEKDLVDSVWTDRPELSKQPVWELSTEHVGLSRGEKLSMMKDAMRNKGADVLVLTALDDIAWVLNLRGDDVPYNPVFLSYMLIRENETFLYANSEIFNSEIRNALNNDGVNIKAYNDIYNDLKLISKDEIVFVDKASANYMILESLPVKENVRIEESPAVLPKATKTLKEQENERIAHVKDGVAVTKLMCWLKKNVGNMKITEISAADKLEEFRCEQENYLGQSFDPIMGYAEHGAIVHYSATEESAKTLEPRSFLLADTGGHYLEGTTDITRTIALGELTEEEKRIFTLVLIGNLNLGAVRFMYGTRGENLDYVAREALWKNGLDYNHGTGHGVGYILNVHERPNGIRWRVQQNGAGTAIFEEGMITSNEPGMYIAGKFGVRHENLVLCKKDKTTEYGTFMRFDTLTMVPFDLDAVDTSLMTAEEIERLNAYHKDVYNAISYAFSGEELEWLKNATREIK